jgi:hypothetical protein
MPKKLAVFSDASYIVRAATQTADADSVRKTKSRRQ